MVTARDEVAEAAWDALIEEQAESTPGTYLQEGEVLSRGGTEEEPAPMRVNSLRYKGYVEVWDTLTGDMSLQPWWLLWQTMRKRREDGSQVFTRTNPNIPPDHGADLFCPLNPEAPADQRFTGRGFKACRKRHIPHWDAMQSHVEHSHKRAWKAMERLRTERERMEDRELQLQAIATQNAVLTALAGRMGQPSLTTAGETSTAGAGNTTTVAASMQEKPKRLPVTKACAVCGEGVKGTQGFDLTHKMKDHMTEKHPDPS